MQRETTRRAVLGGLAVASAGTAGCLFQSDEQTPDPVRYLRPADSISESETFAYVGGVASDGQSMTVEVAMRQTAHENRPIRLFAGSDQPAKSSVPGLRSLWRFGTSVAGMTPGEYTLEVGDATLPVVLESALPPRFRNTRLELSARSVWRTDFAHAYGYDTGPDTGRLHVEFREPTGTGSDPLTRIEFQTPDGAVVGALDLPAGVWSVTLDLDPFDSYEADSFLRGYRESDRIDEVTLSYN